MNRNEKWEQTKKRPFLIYLILRRRRCLQNPAVQLVDVVVGDVVVFNVGGDVVDLEFADALVIFLCRDAQVHRSSES
jgi:hypothetical protein